MTTIPGAPTAAQLRAVPEATTMVCVDAPVRRADRQNRLDKIEYLIGLYRMRYMHYVWRDHLPEAGEMERKINRLLERWQRVHNKEIAATGTS